MLKLWHPAYVLIAVLAVLPLMAAVPLASRVARIAVTASPHYVYTVGLLVLFAAWIGQRDRWLGGLVAWLGVSLLWTPTVSAFETVETIVMSALALTIVRALPEEHHGVAVSVIVATGLFQVVDGLQQYLGYDMLFHGLKQIQPIAAVFGTTGNSNYFGVLLAMIAPLAPWWSIPFFLLGIVLSHSLLAVAAVSIGLLWRVRENKKLLAFGLSAAFLGVVGIMVLKGQTPLSGFYHRLAVWQLATDNLNPLGWLIGAGPGNWAMHIPALQIQQNIYPNEVFIQGHNEWLQLVYENGLVALALLVGWLWAQRHALAGPYGGSVLAILFTSVGMFGFRLAITGCIALVILGLATADSRQDTMREL